MRCARNKVVARSLRRISQQHRGHGIAGSGGSRRVVGEICIEVKAAKRALRWGSIGFADHVLDHIDAELETMCAALPGHIADVFYLVFPPDLWFAPRIPESSKTR